MSDREKLVCMAMDAMRLCLGIRPRNFKPDEIVRFVRNRARATGARYERHRTAGREAGKALQVISGLPRTRDPGAIVLNPREPPWGSDVARAASVLEKAEVGKQSGDDASRLSAAMAALYEIRNVLDLYIGDTDPPLLPGEDSELVSEYPLIYCCIVASRVLNDLP